MAGTTGIRDGLFQVVALLVYFLRSRGVIQVVRQFLENYKEPFRTRTPLL